MRGCQKSAPHFPSQEKIKLGRQQKPTRHCEPDQRHNTNYKVWLRVWRTYDDEYAGKHAQPLEPKGRHQAPGVGQLTRRQEMGI